MHKLYMCYLMSFNFALSFNVCDFIFLIIILIFDLCVESTSCFPLIRKS